MPKLKEFAEKNALNWFVKADEGRSITGGYCGDLLSWVMGKANSGEVWITIMSNINTLAVATLTDVSCILLTDGVVPDAELVETAIQKGVNILGTEKTSYKAAVMLSEYLA